MKTLRFLFPVLGLLTGSVVGAAPAKPAEAPRAQVTFTHPEKFTDVKEDQFGSEKGRNGILDQIRDYIVQQAKNYIPEGQMLAVDFTDIDLAGDFEPWRGPQFSDVRIVKDVYPPSMKFHFKVTDASGRVIKEGDRQLRDLAFQMNINIHRDDPLRYDKQLLEDWMRDEFPRRK